MTDEQTAHGIDEYGRPEPPLSADEVGTLKGFLDYQRATLEWKCRGLTDEQLRTSLAPTNMTLGGLLQHMARVEDLWFLECVAESPLPEPWASMEWSAEWETAAEDSESDLRRVWAERADSSRAIVAEQLAAGPAALDGTHPAWGGQGHVSLRWVLVHMIEEYARHNGHADLLRQSIDGETGE